VDAVYAAFPHAPEDSHLDQFIVEVRRTTGRAHQNVWSGRTVGIEGRRDTAREANCSVVVLTVRDLIVMKPEVRRRSVR
jgi:hypothetical protein